MTGNFALDWATLAVSLFNTLLLLWLGLTVFVNAERRSWGIWLATGGLLLGAMFFISHSAILGHGLSPITPGLNFWWQVGWIPVATLPFGWYVVMLWYSGFWERQEAQAFARRELHRRHRLWFPLTLIAGLLLTASLFFFNPLPSFSDLAFYNLTASPSIGGIPLLILIYPLYTLMCIGLSVDVLSRPGPSGRLMGDLARQRARRWLIAVALILLAVSLLVGWVMVWIVNNIQQSILTPKILITVGRFDFVIETLIAVSILLLGQAVVTYEVFTGKSLPRRGLWQYWRRAVILAAGYSLILAGSLTLQLRPIYSILLSMVLMVVFFALLGWRAYAERERFMRNLRPFVTNQRLYEGIVDGDTDDRLNGAGEDLYEPFRALCEEVLEIRQAYLLPSGALGSLGGAPLIYPSGAELRFTDLSAVISQLADPAETGRPLAPEEYDGMVYAVSLWSERGLTGVMLLGEKQSGSLYTQEEIEIARAVGEHLIDTKASFEMARRLISLQRQRLAHSQVLDQQARRILHDEVLPLVHTSLLNLTATPDGRGEQENETVALLGQIHRRLSDLLRKMPAAGAVEVSRLGLVGALKQVVEVELQDAFDKTVWDIQEKAEIKLDEAPSFVAEVLFFAAREALRNAARYGRRPNNGTLLCISVGLKYQQGLVLMVEDNGAGFIVREPGAPTQAALPDFAPERSSGDRLGSGEGLALHSTMMAVIGGSMTVESVPGEYTRVRLELPELAWKSWE